MNLNLRNSAEDHSQRMLNAIEPGLPLLFHRHKHTSETTPSECVEINRLRDYGIWKTEGLRSVSMNLE